MHTCSFQSSVNIQKKEDGQGRSVSKNQFSSVTLNEPAMKATRDAYCNFELQQGSQYKDRYKYKKGPNGENKQVLTYNFLLSQDCSAGLKGLNVKYKLQFGLFGMYYVIFLNAAYLSVYGFDAYQHVKMYTF